MYIILHIKFLITNNSDTWAQVLRGVGTVLTGTSVLAAVSTVVYLMTSHRDVTWSYVDNMARKMAAFAGQARSKIGLLPNVEL